MFRRLVTAAVVVVITSCGAPALPSSRAAARLDGALAVNVALRADHAIRVAMADLDPSRLPEAFAGPALRALVDQVGWMRVRGLRIEERNPRRAVAFSDAASKEVVIVVEAEHRLLSADQPDAPWSTTMRQWWSRLGYVAGSWLVIDDKDLPPDEWRSAVTAWVSESVAPA
jgi:hypothetical protein